MILKKGLCIPVSFIQLIELNKLAELFKLKELTGLTGLTLINLDCKFSSFHISANSAVFLDKI